MNSWYILLFLIPFVYLGCGIGTTWGLLTVAKKWNIEVFDSKQHLIMFIIMWPKIFQFIKNLDDKDNKDE